MTNAGRFVSPLLFCPQASAKYPRGNEVDRVTGVTLSLATGGTRGDAAGDVYISIDHIYGTPFADFLEGNDLANMILRAAVTM